MTNGYPHARFRAVTAAAVAVAAAAVSAALLPAAVDHGAQADPSTSPVTFTLPKPTGLHELGTFEMHLIDRGRDDPWAEGDAPRELMVSVWYPARHVPGAPRTPYMPQGVASFYDQTLAELGVQAGAVDFLATKTHAQTRAPLAAGSDELPLVLYSPGGGVSRVLGTTLVEELVSHGYAVVTVDSTFQAPVQFPDGMETLAHGVDRKEALRIRVRDIRFVLDQVTAIADGGNPDAQQRPIPDGLGQALDLSRVGMFGHSIGGFATAETMLTDRRIDAGINMDGSMPPGFGHAASRGTDRPFMLIGGGENGDTGEPHNHEGAPDWASFWAHSTGWKRDLYLPDAEHFSFTDMQAILPQLAADLDLDDKAVRDAIGTVDPHSSTAAQRAYVTAFFDEHLRHRPQDLLAGPSPDHPVAHFVQ